MNRNQDRIYGQIGTWTTPTHRMVGCPWCSWTSRAPRRGPGANALATAARLKGEMMRHMRDRHPEQLAGGTNEKK